MKNINIAKSFTLFVFLLLLSASFTIAQEAAVKKVKKDACCTTGDVKTAKHVCTDECKTLGCDIVKAKEAKAALTKHVCTDECKTLGCDVVKVKEAKARLNKHTCTDACKNGCTAKS